MLLIIPVVLCLGAAANGLIAIGQCPSVKSQSTLDSTRYVGVWYELKRFPNANQGNLSCTSATYTLQSDGKVGVKNQGYFADGTIDFIEGIAQVANDARPAELSVDLGFGWPATVPNYFVLDTDYDSYSLVYCCAAIGIIRMEYAWMLTRDRNPDLDVDALEQKLTNSGVDVSHFENVDQNDCP